MKKIMFDDRYGLTRAVLDGRKTMTRRVMSLPIPHDDVELMEWGVDDNGKANVAVFHSGVFVDDIYPKYQPGETVAIAQSYKSIHEEMINGDNYDESRYYAFRCAMTADTTGWNNKMFVRADLMPHAIRITDIKVERLQDISNGDCFNEGFSMEFVNNGQGNAGYHKEAMLIFYDDLGRTKEIRSRDPREAFASLIDKVSGKGTWEKNPWVFAYSFELIK